MKLSDKEREDLRGEVFDLIAEAHVLMFQFNDHLMPGWPQMAGLLKQVGGRLIPSRIGQLIDSPNIAIQRNKDAAKAKENTPIEKPISKAKKRGIPVNVLTESSKSEKDELIDMAKELGIKVDRRMSIETIKGLIA